MRYTGRVTGVWRDGSGLLLENATGGESQAFSFVPCLSHVELPAPGDLVQVTVNLTGTSVRAAA